MRRLNAESIREYFSKDQGELPPFLAGLFASRPDEVVQPRTAEEAIAAVREAHQAGVPIVPRGAGSTAFGQVIPVRGGRVLDLGFMKSIVAFNPADRLITVEAGARWSDISAYLEDKGLALGSCPSSWYTTVGGWIATGGLGLNSYKFGPLRSQIASLRVCFPDGRDQTVEPPNPLFEAFFETEGQMGLVLEATLRVRPAPEASVPVLVPAASLEAAWTALASASREGFDFTHGSVYNSERMRHFNHTLARKMERSGSAVAASPVFAELPSAFFHFESAEEASRFAGRLAASGRAPAPAFQAAYVWMERYYPLKGKRADRIFLGNEVVISNADADAYSDELERLARADGVQLSIESNAAGPGESVVIASFYAPSQDDAACLDGLSLVFRLDDAAHRRGGRLYHVGIYNTAFLDRRFDKELIVRLALAKQRLDPKRLFNPGKFFGLTTRLTGFLPEALNVFGARAFVGLLRTGLGLRIAKSLLALAPGPSRAAPLEDPAIKTARECVNCGFCLPVCPAYLATRDERTTARGKLFLAAKWLGGGKLSGEDVELLHSCMHCGACTSVCQSSLDLVPAWRDLESRVAAEHGRPSEKIEAFVRSVEASADYRRLLRQGYISEPPKPAAAKEPA